MVYVMKILVVDQVDHILCYFCATYGGYEVLCLILCPDFLSVYCIYSFRSILSGVLGEMTEFILIKTKHVSHDRFSHYPSSKRYVYVI